MKIQSPCVVSLDYSLHLGDGAILETSVGSEPLVYLHGAGQIVPGLEQQLEGMDVGQSKQVVVAPDDGYGARDPENVQQVSKEIFGDREIAEGDELVSVDDEQNEIAMRIEKIAGDVVTVDLNHPLAGKTLHFSVTIKDVRAATSEELSHGHVHGDGHAH